MAFQGIDPDTATEDQKVGAMLHAEHYQIVRGFASTKGKLPPVRMRIRRDG